MERAEVLIVGGGPAGSACATALVAAGCSVLVVDQQRFPRDKPCAGWITPEVVERLGLRLDEYSRNPTLQPPPPLPLPPPRPPAPPRAAGRRSSSTSTPERGMP